MAMRPTIPPRLGNRVYEQFSPRSEWKKEGEADLLLVFLPGYVKENIRLTTETKDILRVLGERLVAGNKWNRFQEDYKIPENCNIRGIRAKFDRGILTISMPWKAEIKTTRPTPAPAPAPASAPAPAPAPKPQEAIAKPSSQTTVIPSQAASSNSNTKKAESTSSQAMSTPKPANLPNFTSTIGANKSTDLPSLEPPRPQNVKDDKTSTTASAEMYPNTMEKSVRKENIEGIEKKDKEPNQDEKVIKKIAEKRDEEKTGFGGYSMEESKQVVKGLARGLNEERELMVNMGVAVLVLVALAAYVSYTSFGK